MKKPLNTSALNEPSGWLAMIGAVALARPKRACMTATPSMVRAMPAGSNQAAKAPTAAARMIRKKPMPVPSSRTRVVHTVRNDATSATATPAR